MLRMTVIGGKADSPIGRQLRQLMTQNGHSRSGLSPTYDQTDIARDTSREVHYHRFELETLRLASFHKEIVEALGLALEGCGPLLAEAFDLGQEAAQLERSQRVVGVIGDWIRNAVLIAVVGR